MVADNKNSSSPAPDNANNAKDDKKNYLTSSSYIVRTPGTNGYQSSLAPTTKPAEPVIPTHTILSEPTHTITSHHDCPHHVHNYHHHHPTHSHVHSDIENQIIHAKEPIYSLSSNEVITHGPYHGIYLNKHEVDAWHGPVPIDQYPIHDDPNPEVIKKRLDKVHYVQELGVRYLNPGLAPKPGDLIVRERSVSLPPAPPLIIRQEGSRPHTPPPLIYREAPPPLPAPIPEQVVEVEGHAGEISPRRVILERLSNLPARPQDIIVERWLPWQRQPRRVIHQRSAHHAVSVPRNLIIEWEAPDVEVTRRCRDLGVVDADPADYVRRYGSELKQAHELPTCEHQHHHSHVEVARPTYSTSCHGYHGCHGAHHSYQTYTHGCGAGACHNNYYSHYQPATLSHHSGRYCHYDDPHYVGDLDALRLIGDRYKPSATVTTAL